MILQKIKDMKAGQFGFLLFMSIFIVVGLLALYWGITTIIVSIHSPKWPVAQGHIIQSSIEYDGDNFYADIQYEFIIDSTTYRGSDISFSDLRSSKAHAKDAVARYPLGKKVDVYFNPDNPSKCALEAGFRKASLFIILFGLLFSLLPIKFIQISYDEFGMPPPPDDVPRFKSSFEHVGVVKKYFVRMIIGKIAIFSLIPFNFWLANFLQSKGFFTSLYGSLFLLALVVIALVAESIALFNWDFVNRRDCPSCGLRMKKDYIGEHMVIMCHQCNKYYDLEVSVD